MSEDIFGLVASFCSATKLVDESKAVEIYLHARKFMNSTVTKETSDTAEEGWPKPPFLAAISIPSKFKNRNKPVLRFMSHEWDTHVEGARWNSLNSLHKHAPISNYDSHALSDSLSVSQSDLVSNSFFSHSNTILLCTQASSIEALPISCPFGVW